MFVGSTNISAEDWISIPANDQNKKEIFHDNFCETSP